MNTFTKASLIEKLKQIREMGWIDCRRPGNQGGAGNTLEDLLGIQENNLPIPNANEWELKTQQIPSASLVTIAHKEPSPTALRFVPQVLLPKYGWPHQEAGEKYPASEMSFRQTISGHIRSDRGFMVQVDRVEEKIKISFDYKSVGERHSAWLNSVEARVGLSELATQPYWGFRDLGAKLGTKLGNCFFVQAEKRTLNSVKQYRYSQIRMLETFSLAKFLTALEQGHSYIDFDARTGHNHGTKFRIKESQIAELYSKVTVI